MSDARVGTPVADATGEPADELTTRPPPHQDRRFVALDGWRGICALSVFAFHFNIRSNVTSSQLIRHADIFVEFFFVLSGFVIMHSLRKKHGPFHARPFLVRRIARFWPVHVVMLVLAMSFDITKHFASALLHIKQIVDVPTGFAGVRVFVVQLLLIEEAVPWIHGVWNLPSWSISSEWLASILFAGVILLRPNRYAYSAIALAIVAGALIATVGELYLGLLRCIYSYSLGTLAYIWFDRNKARWAAGPRLPFWISSGLEIALVAAVVVAVMHLEAIESVVGYGKFVLFPLLFTGVVLFFALEWGVLSRLLHTAPFRFAGEHSYCIYMCHAFLIALVASGFRFAKFPVVPILDVGGPLRGDVVVAAVTLLVLAFSYALRRTVELPGQAAMRRALERKHAPIPHVQAGA